MILYGGTPHDPHPVCLPGQHLPQPHGGVYLQGPGGQAGRGAEFEAASAGTSSEEYGNPVYPPARRKLAEHGIACAGKTARQLTRADYDRYDLLIGMESRHLAAMRRICGGDPAGKMHRLLDYTAARRTSPTPGTPATLTPPGTTSNPAAGRCWGS